MTPKVYDIVYSIGYDCTAARYMGKYFLRSYAGPFDWITLCDFPTRMEYILNDFENFMNKEDMVFINRPPEHDYLNPKMIDYRNTRDTIFKNLHSKGQSKRRWLRLWHKFWVKTVSLFIFYRPWRKEFKLRHMKV